MGIFALTPLDEVMVAWKEREVSRVHRYCFNARRESTATWATWDEALRWCADQFGTDTYRWRESSNAVFICFRDKDDAFAFRMRWC